MSAVKFILGAREIDLASYFEEYYGFYPEVLSEDDGYMPHFVVKLRKAFKRGSGKRKQSYYSAELLWETISIDVVESKGLRPPLSKKVKLSELYSFCIDERIYYRRLISKPSLGPSPPLLSL